MQDKNVPQKKNAVSQKPFCQDDYYCVTKLLDDKTLLYIHYTVENGYFFNKSLLGVAVFKKDKAAAFVSDFGDSTASIAPLKVDEKKFGSVRATPVEADLMVQKNTKKAKQKAKLGRRRERERQQGPFVAEQTPTCVLSPKEECNEETAIPPSV